ncbi:MAG: NAD(P)/FAD-dependent oxidoreductase [Psychrobacter sp.]
MWSSDYTLNTLLSQRRNVLSPKFWQFIKDIIQFNKHIKNLRREYDDARRQGKDTSAFTEQTLGSYLAQQSYGKLFTDNYLLPMVSAIWSSSLSDVQDFPLVFFAQFFDNHGLLDVVNRPQWFTIKGGSKQYVNKLVTRFVKAGGEIKVNCPVQSVTRQNNQVVLTIRDKNQIATDKLSTKKMGANDEEQLQIFDEVIFACHADTALKILEDAHPNEKAVLSRFRFTKNTAVLHTDTRVLPNKPLAWASWNYLIDENLSNKTTRQESAEGTASNDSTASTQAPAKPVLTYHMNILQRLTKKHNYLVTLNPETVTNGIDERQVVKRIDYSHPVFDLAMIDAQTKWSSISGNGSHTHFCGAYWFNGFHEDGVRSGLRVCQALGHGIDIKDEVDLAHLPDAKDAHTPFRYKDLPVKADTKSRKVNKRQVVTATTNHELNDYVERIQSSDIDSMQKKKRGIFGRRKAK